MTDLIRTDAPKRSSMAALAIVRRWAPAECRSVAAPARSGRPVAASAVSAALAPRGLGRTLRARFLATHRPGGAPRGRAGLRVQPWSPLARMGGHAGKFFLHT